MSRQFRIKRHGTTLVVTLMMAAIAVVFAFSLVGSSVFQLNMSYRVTNLQDARNLAESAISQTIRLIQDNRAYGSNNESKTVTLQGAPTGSQGMVTFAQGYTVNGTAIPYSTCNVGGGGSIAGYGGRTVPQGADHLVGVGMCNGVVARVEAIVTMPRFPFVIACTGPFQSTGGLVVGGVKDIADAPTITDPSKLLPASMLSDSPNAKAIQAGSGALVTGNVQAVGGIDIPTTSVKGKIFPNAQQVPITSVPMADPTQGVGNVQSLATSMDSPTLEGFCRSSGPVTVNGDLTMNDALLYVNGVLTVTGAIQGKGALYVNGAARINRGGSSVSADNVNAIIASGDVHIGPDDASGTRSSFFGMVYTGGNFFAQNIDLYGAFIGNAPGSGTSAQLGGLDTSGSHMATNNVRLVTVNDLPKQEIQVQGVQTAPTPNVPLPPASLTFTTTETNWDFTNTISALVVASRPGLDAFKDTSTSPPTYNWQSVNANSLGMMVSIADSTGQPANFAYGSTEYYQYTSAHQMVNLQPTVDKLVKGYVDYMKAHNGQLTASPGTGTGGTRTGPIFTFSFDRFLTKSDNIQVQLWQDL